MDMINGIIKDGRVYITDPEYMYCSKCDLSLTCKNFMEKYDHNLCSVFGANENNDFGFRYSLELTEKLNKK